MNDEAKVVVAGYDDASAARSASRALLEAGITPSVRVDGERRLVEVPAESAHRAGELLGDAAAPSPPVASDAASGSPTGESPVGDVETAPRAAPGTGVPDTATDTPAEPSPVRVEHRPDVDGFTVVALVDGHGAADTMAATLVEAGIGSRCVPAHEHGYASVLSDADSMVVQVLVEQASRALALLGTEPPQPLPAIPDIDHAARPAGATGAVGPVAAVAGGIDAGTDPSAPSAKPARPAPKADSDEVRSYLGGRVQLTRRQLTLAIVLYVAALVLIPLTFYFGTQWILTPEVGDPMTTLPEIPGR